MTILSVVSFFHPHCVDDTEEHMAYRYWRWSYGIFVSLHLRCCNKIARYGHILFLDQRELERNQDTVDGPAKSCTRMGQQPIFHNGIFTTDQLVQDFAGPSMGDVGRGSMDETDGLPSSYDVACNCGVVVDTCSYMDVGQNGRPRGPQMF
jgi:hypothetical protein